MNKVMSALLVIIVITGNALPVSAITRDPVLDEEGGGDYSPSNPSDQRGSNPGDSPISTPTNTQPVQVPSFNVTLKKDSAISSFVSMEADWSSVKNANSYRVIHTSISIDGSTTKFKNVSKTKFETGFFPNPGQSRGYCVVQSITVEALKGTTVIARGSVEKCVMNDGKEKGTDPRQVKTSSTGTYLNPVLNVVDTRTKTGLIKTLMGNVLLPVLSWNLHPKAKTYQVYGVYYLPGMVQGQEFSNKAMSSSEIAERFFGSGLTLAANQNVNVTSYQLNPISPTTLGNGCVRIKATVEARDPQNKVIETNSIDSCVFSDGLIKPYSETDGGTSRGATTGSGTPANPPSSATSTPTSTSSTTVVKKTLLGVLTPQLVEPSKKFPFTVTYSPTVKKIVVSVVCEETLTCPKDKTETDLKASGGSISFDLGTAPSQIGSSYTVQVDAFNSKGTVVGRIGKRIQFIPRNSSGVTLPNVDSPGRESDGTQPVVDPYTIGGYETPPYKFDITQPIYPPYSDGTTPDVLPYMYDLTRPDVTTNPGQSGTSYQNRPGYTTPGTAGGSTGSISSMDKATREALLAHLAVLQQELLRRMQQNNSSASQTISAPQGCNYPIPYKYPISLNVCPVK